jgi:uncharacterized membrane protein (UPF0127 family)
MIVSQETHTCSKYKKAIIELSQETNTRSKYEKGSFVRAALRPTQRQDPLLQRQSNQLWYV